MERKILKQIIEKNITIPNIQITLENGRDKGLGEGCVEEFVLNGYRVSIWDDRKILEIDIGDSCTTVCMYLMPMKCTLKMDKMQVLWLYICMSIYTMHMHVLSHVRLCNTMSCSPPGSSVHGISQARKLEWIAISSSRGSSRPRDQTHVSCFSRTGRWVLYHWATWEAPIYTVHTHIYNHYKHFFNHWKKTWRTKDKKTYWKNQKNICTGSSQRNYKNGP